MPNATATLALGAVLSKGTKATFNAISAGLKDIGKELTKTAKDMVKMGKVDAADAVGHVAKAFERLDSQIQKYNKEGKKATDTAKRMIAPFKDMGDKVTAVKDAWKHYQKTSNKTATSTAANIKRVKSLDSALGILSRQLGDAGVNQDKWLKGLKWSNIQQGLNNGSLKLTGSRMDVLSNQGKKLLGITGKTAKAFDTITKTQSIYNRELKRSVTEGFRYQKAVESLGKSTGYNNQHAKIWSKSLHNVQTALNATEIATRKASTSSKVWIRQMDMASVTQQVMTGNIKATAKGFQILNEKGLKAFKGLSYEAAKTGSLLTGSFAGLSVKEGTAKLTAYGKATEEASVRSAKFRKQLDGLVKDGVGVSKAFETRYQSMKKTDDLWRKHTDSLHQAGKITTATMHKMNAAFNANAVASKSGLTGHAALTEVLGKETKRFQSLQKTIATVSSETGISEKALIKQANVMKKAGKSTEFQQAELRKHIKTSRDLIKATSELQAVEKKRASLTGKSVESIQKMSRARMDSVTNQQALLHETKKSIIAQKEVISSDKRVIKSKRDAGNAIKKLNVAYSDQLKTNKNYVDGLKYIREAYTKSNTAGKIATSRVKALASGYAQASTSTGLFRGAVDRVTKSLKSFASYATAASAIAGFIQIMRSGVSAIVAYDQALKDLQAITGATDHQITLMGQKMKTVASDTKFSTTEVADGMKVLGQAGLDAGEAIQTIAAVANLATGTLTDMNVSVDLITTAMRVFNIRSIESADIADIFANAVNKSKLTVDKLRTALNYVGPVAHSSGTSLEETAAAMMTLANSGQKASKIGTGLRRIFSELVKPSKKLKVAAERVGVSIEALSPTMNSFGDVLSNLQVVLTDTEVAFELFGKRGASAALALVQNMDSGYDKMLKSTKQFGTAASMAAKQMEGLGVSWKNFSDKMGLVAVALGEAGLINVLKVTVDVARDLADSLIYVVDNGVKPLFGALGKLLNIFGDLTPYIFKSVAAIVALTLAYKAFIKTVLILGSLKLTAFFTSSSIAAVSLTGIIVKLRVAFQSFFLIISTNPIAAFVTVLAGATVAIIAMTKSASDQIEEYEKLKGKVETTISSIGDFIEELERLQKAGAQPDDIEKFIDKLLIKFPELAAEVIGAKGNIYSIIEELKKFKGEKRSIITVAALTTGITGLGKSAVEAALNLNRLSMGFNFSTMFIDVDEEKLRYRQSEKDLKDHTFRMAKIIVDTGTDIEALDWSRILGVGFDPEFSEYGRQIREQVATIVKDLKKDAEDVEDVDTLSLYGISRTWSRELEDVGREGKTIYNDYLKEIHETTGKYAVLNGKINDDSIKKFLQNLRDMVEEARKIEEGYTGEELLQKRMDFAKKWSTFLQKSFDKESKDASVYYVSKLMRLKERIVKEEAALKKGVTNLAEIQRIEQMMHVKAVKEINKILRKQYDDDELLQNAKAYAEKQKTVNAEMHTAIEAEVAKGVITQAEGNRRKLISTKTTNKAILKNYQDTTKAIQDNFKHDKEILRKSEKKEQETKRAIAKTELDRLRFEAKDKVKIVKDANQDIQNDTKDKILAIGTELANQAITATSAASRQRVAEIAGIDAQIVKWEEYIETLGDVTGANELLAVANDHINELMRKRTTLINGEITQTKELIDAKRELTDATRRQNLEYKAGLIDLAPQKGIGIERELSDAKALAKIREQMATDRVRIAALATAQEDLVPGSEESLKAEYKFTKALYVQRTIRYENKKSIIAQELALEEYYWERGRGNIERYTELINQAVEHKVITWEEGNRRLMHSTDNMHAAFKYGWDEFMANMDTVADEMANLAQYMGDALTDGLADTLMEIVDGTKSAKEAFTDFAISVIRDITRMAIKMAILQAISGIFGAGGGAAAGGVIPGRMAEGGEIQGHSPTSTSDNIPIWATAKEYMQPVDAVKYYGLEVMEGIRKKLFPKEMFAGIKNGANLISVSNARTNTGRAKYASGGAIGGSGGSPFSVYVPVSVSGVTDVDNIAGQLQEGIEETVITILKREFT